MSSLREGPAMVAKTRLIGSRRGTQEAPKAEFSTSPRGFAGVGNWYDWSMWEVVYDRYI